MPSQKGLKFNAYLVHHSPPPNCILYERKNLDWKGTEIMHLWFPKTCFPRKWEVETSSIFL